MNDQAYNRNLPCLNPTCKSHGQPHPNCKCYSFAEGGMVSHYCSQDRKHMTGCMYAKGGSVSLQPKGSQGLFKGIDEPAMAALAHGGASMLFGSPKTPFFSAFGSGSNRMQALVSPEDELESNITNYLAKVKRGSSTIDQGVASLFDGSKFEHEPASDKEKEQIKDYVAQNGIMNDINEQVQQQYNTPSFAEGGEVCSPKREDPLSSVFPDHNIALSASKVRVANYLNSVRPSEIQSKLPFDSKRPTDQQEKDYDKVVSLAAKPLTILNHLSKGNITPDTVKHFTNMYPDLRDHLNKKMAEELTKAQLEDRKPKYSVRQGLSLFVGAPMDSTMTPQSMAAVQSMFAQQAQQQQQQPAQNKPKKKKDSSTLSKMSENYATGDQAAAARQKQ